jgi:hypothetical protein
MSRESTRIKILSEYSLSVVMPVKGDSAGMINSMRSILGQSLRVEWIIVRPANDRITEESLAKLPNDSRIVILDEESKGIYPAMNQGLANAKGKFVTFFGAGDFWVSENSASHMIDRLESKKGNWGLGSWFFIKQDGSLICAPSEMKITKNDVFKTTTPLCHQSVVASKKLLLETGGFNTELTVAADRKSIHDLWGDSDPVIWDFPTVAYLAGGFSSINEAKAHEELAMLDSESLRTSHNTFFSHFNSRIIFWFFQVLKKMTSQRTELSQTAKPFEWLPNSIKCEL